MRIERIRAINGCTAGLHRLPERHAPPVLQRRGRTPLRRHSDWARQTTVQRWYADPIVNNAGNDRTLRTVFTHDHFGPSTHQQAGLYAGLVVEPAGSTLA